MPCLRDDVQGRARPTPRFGRLGSLRPVQRSFDANLHLQAPGNLDASPLPSRAIPVSQSEPPPDTAVAIDIPIGSDEIAELAEPASDPFRPANPHDPHIELQDATDDAITQPQPSIVEPRVSPVANIAKVQPPEALDAGTLSHAFLKPTTARTSPKRRWVGVMLALVSGILGIALLLQVVVRERDRLVAMEPAARSILVPLCSVLGCIIAPLRQIESVVIDSSSFTKVRADIYRLGFTLKNTAQIPLATPAVELTLTDLQDQAVVRKVFLTSEFAENHAVLEPGAELPTSLSMSIKLNGNSEKISGYRLLSFYP